MDRWTTYEMAEVCFQAERLCFGVAGGWQDQYASAFGGFNLMEFDGARNLVHPIRLDEAVRHELEECLLLCDTGIEHDSNAIHAAQRAEFEARQRSDELKDAVNLCRKMHVHLTRGELLEFGRALHAAWQLKRGFSAAVSNEHLDRLYAVALAAGAFGGKLLGAGGGGFFLFFVPPQRRAQVTQALKAQGCTMSSFKLEPKGVVSWRTKVL